MYKALHSIVHPLVEKKQTGIMRLVHDYQGKGAIYLKEGEIEGIQTMEFSGAQAARRLAAWMSFTDEFLPTHYANISEVRGVETDGFMELLERMAPLIADIARVIPGNEAIFKTLAHRLNGERSFTQKELQIVMALDGHATVKEVVRESGMTEFEVLYIIKKFCDSGLSELWYMPTVELSA